jgi:DNA-binding MarR family transcriptional regulator
MVYLYLSLVAMSVTWNRPNGTIQYETIRDGTISYKIVLNGTTVLSSGNSNMRPWELLLRNANVLQSVLEKAEPELSLLELDARRLFILCTVEANAFPAELARVLSMPKPSMTFLIKKLEESGYLRRQGEKGDLRRYRLTITPAGIKARDKGAEAVNRIFGACLNSLSAADQATLSRILGQLQPRTSKTKRAST